MQEESRALLENSAYVPGDSGDGTPILPRKQTVLESLSSVLENCALLSDVILRLPMISKRLLFENNKWFVGTHWCISFTNSTGLIDDTTHRLLNLVAQELDIIPKDKNYYNPFDEQRNADSKAKFADFKDEKKTADKQKKRKISKGPKLSKRIEL
ncbi:coiled-coil domain-containing protein 134-like protein [Leptotrombidium deliense]|uniref:Coiled-coil domain-containing protein 134-like protein n=1 Tax=Leptotrombidium deliense TaxID=299467 RepID=A0A443S3B7_9ACAR|nr:coiled-coil domain-containing protein 134-like protein [Leptotrombidium deliense]